MAEKNSNFKSKNRDLVLLSQCPVTLYHNLELLDNDLEWLQEADYNICDIDAIEWKGNTAFREFIDALGGVEYRPTLDGLEKCLGNLFMNQYLPQNILADGMPLPPKELEPSDCPGFVFVLRHYDWLVSDDSEIAHQILDFMVKESRSWLLYNKRLICLVQTDDPDLSFHPLGAEQASWTDAEFLRKNRVFSRK